VQNLFIQNKQNTLNYSVLIGDGGIQSYLSIDIDGIKVLNQNNYLTKYKDLNVIKPKDFVEYMQYKGRSLPIKKTHYIVYRAFYADGTIEGDTDSPLVINLTPSAKDLKKENLIDKNIFYESIPFTLYFDVIADLVYNTNQVKRKSLTVKTTLPQESIANPSFIDQISEGITLFLDNPFNWFLKNILWIGTLILFIGAVSVAWYNFKGGGGATINNIVPRYNRR
jgi:hypothetical protein